MSFVDFPWFKNAAVCDVFRVRRPHPIHLRWPSLDVDLELEAIEHPERFPLMMTPVRPASPRPVRDPHRGRSR